MQLPDELKPDLHRTLLGPLSVANEIYGALIPGCVFSLLLLSKGRGTALLSSPLLGYRTKLACALIVSYVFGKVAFGVVGIIGEPLLERSVKAKNGPSKVEKEPAKAEGNREQVSVLQKVLTSVSQVLGAAPEELTTFLAGVIAGPFMMGKSRAYEYFAATLTQVNFYLSTGLVILVGAAIPGDGQLRFLEAQLESFCLLAVPSCSAG